VPASNHRGLKKGVEHARDIEASRFERVCGMKTRSVAIALAVSLLLVAPTISEHMTAAANDPTVVASGLINPKGFTWAPDGTLYVALADAAGAPRAQTEPVPATPATAESVGAQPTVPGIGQEHAGTQSASVVKIEDGCPVTVATGFPSSTDPNLGWAFGASAVAFLDNQLYVLVDGGGASTMNDALPNGLYLARSDGTFSLVADLSAWFRANPVADPHEPITPDGEPFAMVANDGALWVSESNQEQFLKITPDGTITRVVDFSPLGDVVPTGIVPDPNGGWFVGFLSSLPFTEGAAVVRHVATDGTVTDVWTGLTAVTAVAVGPDGTLFATELTTGPDSGTNPPFVIPGAGRIVEQTGPSSSAVIATGLSAPTSLAFGNDGRLYVGGPAIGAYSGEGQIIALDPASAGVDLSGLSPTTACPRDA
jgi:hypothetical protein